MTELPDTNPFVRFVFENPWPFGVGLLALGVIIAGVSWRDGRLDRVRLALVPLILGAAIIVIGQLVTTPAEHARSTIRAFAEAIEAGDAVAAKGLLARDVRFHIGAETNSAWDAAYLHTQIDRVLQRFTVDNNMITKLDTASTNDSGAMAHLSCLTEAGGWGPSRSRWVVRVEQADDGSWPISRLTWVSLNGRAASDVR